jgi:PAS domain S-box-containing protein
MTRAAADSESARLEAPDGPGWYFLDNHALVLLALVGDPDATVRELAEAVGVTERTAFRVLRDLEAEGYIRREGAGGRGGRFIVAEDQPLPHPLNHSAPIRQLIDLLGSSEVTTWRWNPTTDEVEGPESSYRLHGLVPQHEPSSTESAGSNMHQDDWPRVRDALEQAKSLGEIDVTYRVMFPDGSLNWIRARGARGPVDDTFHGTFTDITHETEIEAARSLAEARLQLVFSESATPMFVFGPSVRLDAVNDAFAHTLGRDRTELVARRLEDFVEPDDIVPLREASEQLTTGGDTTIAPITLIGKRRRSIRCSIRLQVDSPDDAQRVGVGVVQVAS